MARKKRILSCICGQPTTTYRKGKGHRVIVCPSCGIIATNPIPLIPLALAAAPKLLKGAGKLLKGAGRMVGIGGDYEPTPTSQEERASRAYPPAQHYKNQFTTEEKVALALR